MTQKKQVLCDLQVLFSDIQLSNSRTWNSQEPAYADGGDEMVIDSVTMDRIGVPLLTIDARDGSVVQRVQSGPSTTFPGGIGECE